MKISSKSIYGIKACIHLCKSNELIGTDKLSEVTDCPKIFLNKIMSELIEAGIVNSRKGPKGGYYIEEEGRSKTIKDIIQALKEKTNEDDCSSEINVLLKYFNSILGLSISTLSGTNDEIYLDHAATTPLDERVLSAMLPYFGFQFGNANSVHGYGIKAGSALDNARRCVAGIIHAEKGEIVFTSGGTEANNWVIKGGANEIKKRNGKNKIIVSAFEHPSILEPAKQMEQYGYTVQLVYPNKDGIIEEESLESALKGNDVALVSIMMANNEIGTIQDIKNLCRISHNYGAYFHTDAVQAIGTQTIDVKELGIDYLSFSAHKFYGPKGVGCLYIKAGAPIEPLIIGGAQERGKRGGTSNVPLAIGLAKALELSRIDLEENSNRIESLRDYLQNKILNLFPFSYANAAFSKRVPSCLSITFPGERADALISILDLKGIAVSAGSACSSGSIEPSHVLSAIGLSSEDAKSTIRFSLGRKTTATEIEKTIEVMRKVLLRD